VKCEELVSLTNIFQVSRAPQKIESDIDGLIKKRSERDSSQGRLPL